MANRLTTALTKQGFVLKATDPSGSHSAVDPGKTALYDGLLLLNNNHPAPLHIPKPAKIGEQLFITDQDAGQQACPNRYFGLALKAGDLK